MDAKARYAELLEIYEDKLDTLEQEIDLDSKRLVDALKNQLHLQMDWELLSKKVSYLFDYCEQEVETSYSLAVQNEMKNQHRMCTISEAKEYAKANTDYRAAKRIMIKVRELRDECRGILDVVNSRKYILNNMTNALVAGVNDTIL